MWMDYDSWYMLSSKFFQGNHADCSEYGKPKILLYERPPTGMQNINGIRQIATFPMSAGYYLPYTADDQSFNARYI